MDTFARVGLLGRAGVYFLTGVFALLMLTGQGDGAVTDNKGSIQHLFHHAWGAPALFVLVIGLVCYAVFRIFQSIRDYDHRGSDFKGLILRAGYFFGGAVHLFLAYFALNMFAVVGYLFVMSAWHHNSAEARGMKGAWSFFGTQPFGIWIELVIALGLIAFAFYGVIEARYRHYTDR